MLGDVRTPGAAGARGREPVLVGLVDLGALAALVVVGQLSHGIDPITAPLAALETTVPFLLGWLLIAPLSGVYAREALSIPRTALCRTTVGWLAAANVGFVLRSSPAFDGGLAWAFTLVMSATGLAVLAGWRLAYATIRGGPGGQA